MPGDPEGLLPSTTSVDVGAVIHEQNPHESGPLVDLTDHSVGTHSGRVEPFQVPAERLAHPSGVLHQRAQQEVQYRYRHLGR